MNVLNNWILIVFTVITSTSLFAQNKSTDQLVEDFLGTTEYESSLKNNPGLIKYLKVKSLEGYAIETIPSEKAIQLEFLPLIHYRGKKISANQFETDLKSPDFNFLLYNFPTIEKGAYRLSKGNTAIIIIYSNEQINRKMRKY